MPEHHVPEEMLLAYAAGSASEAHALVCAVHLTTCEVCRDELALLEQVGGALLEDAPASAPIAARPAAEASPAGRWREGGALPPGAEGWPRPLHPYVRGRRFRWHAPGIHVLETELRLESMPVRVARIDPGTVIDRHTHRGSETLVVLAGGFVDRGAHSGPGDVAIADGEVEHDIRIDDGGPCDTLVVNQHPLLARTLRGRLFARLRPS
jgi:putative transcriptional regulator